MEHLHAVLLLPLQILSPESVDSVNHDLDQLDLRVAETVLVGDVIGASSLATRFSTGSTGLDIEFFTASLESVNRFLGPAREVNVDGSAHASSKIGGAGVDVSVLLGESIFLARFSLNRSLNSSDSTGKTCKDTLDITSLFHGDDTGLVLLVNPQKEGLGFIVEDTTALRPVTLHTSNSQVTVTIDKEEMIIDQLLADLLVHASERVVGTGKISRELGEGVAHQLLNINTLLLGDSGGESKSINVASNTDTGGVDWDTFIDVSSDLGRIHVRGVLGISRDSMVVLDDGIKDLGEILVGVPVTGIDSTVLVVEFNGTSTSLGNGEATGLGLDVLDFVPSLLGHMLGDQRVGGLDGWEFSRHDY